MILVGDFKLVGPGDNMKKAWSLIRDVIAMDDPTILGKYLGCGHEKLYSVSLDVASAPLGHIPLLSSQSRASNGSAVGDSQRQPVQEATPCSEGTATYSGGAFWGFDTT